MIGRPGYDAVDEGLITSSRVDACALVDERGAEKGGGGGGLFTKERTARAGKQCAWSTRVRGPANENRPAGNERVSFFFLRIIPGKSGDRARRRRRGMSWGGKEIEGWSDRALESV